MGYAEALKSKESKYLLEKFKSILFRNPYFPSAVVMDNAPEFSKIKKYLKSLDIDVALSPSRHPQTNGSVENFNRSFKSRLKACTNNFENWDRNIYKVLHEINSSDHAVTKLSPFTIQTGMLNPHASFDNLLRKFEDKINVNFDEIKYRIDCEKENRCKKFDNPNYKEYEIGEKVLLKNFKGKYPPFIGPFIILEKSETAYKLKEDGKTGKRIFSRHANDLRKFIERDEKGEEMNSLDETEIETDNEKMNINLQPVIEFQSFSYQPAFVKQPDCIIDIDPIAESNIFEENIRSSENLSEISDSSIESDSSSSEESVIFNEDIPHEKELLENHCNIAINIIEYTIFSEYLELCCDEIFDQSILQENFIKTTPTRTVKMAAKNIEAEIVADSINQTSEELRPFNTTNQSEYESPSRGTCLDYITESSIDSTHLNSEKDLTEFDNLELSFNLSAQNENTNKRPRIGSNDSLPCGKRTKDLGKNDFIEDVPAVVDGNNHLISNVQDILEPSNQILEKHLSAAKGWNLQNSGFGDMSIRIEFPTENVDLFERIDKNYETFAANDLIEKGCILKLKDLPKDLLLYILFKFNQSFSTAENCKELRFRIKTFMDENHPDWRKTENNEYLFFGVLCLKKPKTIYQLSMPELKCLCAAYNLPRVRSTAKTFLVEFIISQFEILYPDHPKMKNTLIFYPDTNL